MKGLDFGRVALTMGVAAAMLAGCGGSQPPIGAPSSMPQSRAIATQAKHGGSWMLPEAKSDDLLYVTGWNNVAVYSYPAGKLKGILTGFDSPVGDCVDKSGNVFITNQMPAKIYEYVHGGTKRIATLEVDKDDVGPVGCAIDPTTGNLAVTGFSHGADIFNGARGRPTFYKDKGFYAMQFCAYDGKGDLFADGNTTLKRSGLVELSKGATKFTDISLSVPISSDGGVQWTGNRLAVGGFFPVKSSQPVIYRYLINGQEGTETGMTSLGSPGYIVLQFLIDGPTVVVPNEAQSRDSVLYYNYPRGGAPIKQILRHVTGPRGVVVSRAQGSQNN